MVDAASRRRGERRKPSDSTAAPVGSLCPRCRARYRAGKSLDCPDCEEKLGSTTETTGESTTAGDTAAQAKRRIGSPDDRYEREAERVSKAVVRGSVTSTTASTATPPTIQRRAVGSGRTADSDVSPPGGGRPLPASVRTYFEPRFGTSFEDVRVHTGPRAAESARAIHARAYTLGTDVVFGAGEYAPETPAGRQLIAHELTHVLQQRAGSERVQKAECVHPPGRDLSTVEAPPIGETGPTTTVRAFAGDFNATRITHRYNSNKQSQVFGSSCECVDAARYRIEIYEVENNPWEWVKIHMSAKRNCCSTQANTSVNQACRGVPGGFVLEDTFVKGEAYFFDPSDESDRDILSDVGSAASILGLVVAIAIPGVPPAP
ncbi:eCIS core domain-containing protein [Salinigranum salinum]|uniref:eCIS core domain-containing protein n=1 Tax=Salinigranum salinum TaxID=1364937 RepID=UPI0018646FA2|nr:DUF4157 domain-containing protein [Salinigranum salinum]